MKLSSVAENFRELSHLMRCPLCGQDISVSGGASLVCEGGHCFDLSKRGYVNFLPSRAKKGDMYGAELFEARGAVFASGLYEQVADAVEGLMPAGARAMLDAGCGEGYYARAIEAARPEMSILGLDISRDAVIAAARGGGRAGWMMGDIKRLPVKTGALDAVIDILTPADYAEFSRALDERGVLIKAVPGEEYLRELRGALKSRLRSAEYSGESVMRRLSENAEIIKIETVKYTARLSGAQSEALPLMTPMTSGIPRSELPRLKSVTIHMELALCNISPSPRPT